MADAVRFGVELEGPHKGEPTLVLLDAAHHDLGLVRRLLEQHGRTATHIWVETALGQKYDWDKVVQLTPHFKVTALVREVADLPPVRLAGLVALVWDIPMELWPMALSARYLRVLKGSFRGFESPLAFTRLVTDAYDRDEVWAVEEKEETR